MEAVRIGVRIRQQEYLDKYGDEFTIRSGRPSGRKTELTKIVEGWGDYFFYGFGNYETRELVRWTIGNLNVFRLYFNRYLASHNKGEYPGKAKNNTDGSSSFMAFNINDMPDGFIIAMGDDRNA